MPEPRFEIFVDGGCGLCSREARLLAWLDRGRGRLLVTDLYSAEFERGDHDIDFVEAMRSIHGRSADGTVVHGVEVFRRAYAALGLGWLWAPTRLPGVRQLTDGAYRRFARRRFARRLREGCGIAPGSLERVPAA